MTSAKKAIKKIWLVRHGESRGNTGHEPDIDPPLSPRGEEQSRLLAKSLGHIHFDTIYLSPLKRTRQTLELSGIVMNNIVYDSRIVEYRWEGVYDTILPYETVPDYGSPDKHDAWRTPFRDRIRHFADEVRSKDFSNLLIVTHGGASIALVLAFIEGERRLVDDPERILDYLANTGIAQLRLSLDGDECKLVIWNHTAHLGPIFPSNPEDE